MWNNNEGAIKNERKKERRMAVLCSNYTLSTDIEIDVLEKVTIGDENELFAVCKIKDTALQFH